MPWNLPPPPNYVIEGVQPAATFAGALALAIPALDLVQVNVNAMLYGAFGLGPLQFDFKAQLDVAFSASLGFNLAASLAANAQLAAALNAGLTPSFNLNAGIAADLQLKIGGIQLLINLGLDLIFTIPPIVLGLAGMLQLPACYFAIFYGPADTARPWGDVLAQMGLPANAPVGMMMVVANAGAISGTAFVQALGGIYTTSP